MSDAPKKFYIATDYGRKHEAALLAAHLEELGFESTARWYSSQPAYKDDGLGGTLTGDDAAAALKVAEEDLDDIEEAEIFIQLTSGDKARGGRHVELGYALCMKRRYGSRIVVVVGPQEHAFHYHASVVHLPTLGLLDAFLMGVLTGWDLE